MACIVIAYTALANIVIVYTVMAYVVMAYMVMVPTGGAGPDFGASFLPF